MSVTKKLFAYFSGNTKMKKNSIGTIKQFCNEFVEPTPINKIEGFKKDWHFEFVQIINFSNLLSYQFTLVILSQKIEKFF
jgi:hypothetical protein